jgi:predicted dehydrogenase
VRKITTGWRSQAPDYSVTLGGGVHMMDLMLWILGERPQHVFALGNRIVTRDTPFRYADFTSGVMQTPSGCVMRLNANFGCVHRHHHVLRIFGFARAFIYDDQGARLHSRAMKRFMPAQSDLNPLPIHKADLFSSFVSAIVAGDSWDSQIFAWGQPVYCSR